MGGSKRGELKRAEWPYLAELKGLCAWMKRVE